jgi:transposase-like protein
MATPEKLLQAQRSRFSRYFSEDFKKQKVRDIEKNLVSIAELMKEYQISRTAIYKWLYKYSKMVKKGERQIVERKSDTRKMQEFRERIKELERVVGQKQLLIEFQQKMIDLAEQTYDVDIKKKLSSKLSSGSGPTDQDTSGK